MNTTIVHIRRATLADEPMLSSIRRRAIRELAVPVLSAAEAEDWANGAPVDRITRAIRDHEIWVTEAQLGWVEINGNRVAALYVSPNAARQGIGSRLLEHAESIIRAAGFCIASLDASPNALNFYLRRGYTHTGPQTANGAWPLRKEL